MTDTIERASSSAKPVVLLLHAWHTPAHYAAFVSLLEDKGYTTRCLQNPSSKNASPANKTLDDDVNFARQTALEILKEGRDMVALMHSYGGMVGTNALSKLHQKQSFNGKETGRVTTLVYMAGVIPFEGESLLSMMGDSQRLGRQTTSRPRASRSIIRGGRFMGTYRRRADQLDTSTWAVSFCLPL